MALALDVDKVVNEDRAVAVDLDSHSEPGAGVAMGVVLDVALAEELNMVLDSGRVLKIAAREGMGEVLDWGMAVDEDVGKVLNLGMAVDEDVGGVLDLGMAVDEDIGGVLDLGMALDVDMDGVQELGTAAMMILETGQDAVAYKTLGMGVVLLVASDLDRRNPKRVAGDSSGIFL